MRIHGWGLFASGVVLAASGTASAAPTVTAPSQSAGVAVGRASAGGTSYRLQGDRLTITFRKPLAKRGRGVRLEVRARCDHEITALDDAGRAVRLSSLSATRRFVVRGGVRRLRARLSGDVAADANRCGVVWRSVSSRAVAGGRYGPARRSAAAVASRGEQPPRPACAVPPGAERTLERELVVAAALRWDDGSSGGADLIACLRPAGTWRLYERSSWTKYPADRGVASGAGGSWIGWTVADFSSPTGPVCSVARLDLAAPGAAIQRFGDGREARSCDVMSDPVVAPVGAMAWLSSSSALTADGSVVFDVMALTSAGTVLTVAAVRAPLGERGVPVGPTDLAISADGTAVTWRENGIERSEMLR